MLHRYMRENSSLTGSAKSLSSSLILEEGLQRPVRIWVYHHIASDDSMFGIWVIVRTDRRLSGLTSLDRDAARARDTYPSRLVAGHAYHDAGMPLTRTQQSITQQVACSAEVRPAHIARALCDTPPRPRVHKSAA